MIGRLIANTLGAVILVVAAALLWAIPVHAAERGDAACCGWRAGCCR